jgi:phosphate uptake regulator
MFRELINAFRRRDLIKELFGKVAEMLDAGEWMFNQASLVLMRKTDWNQVADALYERDREVNRLEQDIRERIMTHLSLGNNSDLLPCLILISIVKDAERIGDYCKNLFEVGRFYTDAYQHPEFHEPLEEIRSQVCALFEPTRRSVLGPAPSQAEFVMAQEDRITGRCDTIIHQLLKMHGNFPADEAVAYVLLARHYKRVMAHLSNIASSAVSPLPRIDFRPQPKGVGKFPAHPKEDEGGA